MSFKYEYKDPIKDGCKKVKLSRKQHNKLFPKRNISLWITPFITYEYYISDKKFLMQKFVSKFGIFINLILFPANVLFSGLSNFKGLIKEYKSLLNQKKRGNFTCDDCWSNTDKYKEIKDVLSL